MRKHLIFDLDGTLLDSNAVCVAILQQMLDERGAGRSIDASRSAAYMSVGGTQMVSALLAEACIDPVADLAEFRARYAGWNTPVDSLFHGVADGLHRLRESGHLLAICSNKPENLCKKVLADTGIDHLFEVVVGTGEGLRPKPAPDLLDATLRRARINAYDCVFIGDSELDYEVSTTMGMPFMFMSYGYAPQGWAPESGSTFSCFVDFVDHLARQDVARPEGAAPAILIGGR